MSLSSPKEALSRSFISYKVCNTCLRSVTDGQEPKPLLPLSTAKDSLSALGQNPSSTVR